MRARSVLLAVTAILVAASLAQAIPALQLYSPGATYNSSLSMWVPTTDPFTLYVVGTEDPGYVDISSVILDVAVPAGSPASASIHIVGTSANDTTVNVTLGAGGISPAANPGTPPGLPPHGAYPAEYWAVSLPNLLVSTAGEAVYDYTNPADTGVGDIQHYTVSYSGVSLVQFDLQGVADISKNGNNSQKDLFAPFSHDVQAEPVPEPATLALIGCALAGLAARARARGLKRSANVRMPS